jgi:lipopolysaccharide transport system ATP-binding protein
VDEILAVGDQAFQLRCLDKINEMKRRGITIVLVTHDLETVRKMCSRAIWLDDGIIQAIGAVGHVLDAYMARVRAEDDEALQKAESTLQSEGDSTDTKEESSWRWGSREAEIVRVQFLDGEGKEMRTFKTGQPFVARMHYVAHERIDQPLFGVALHHANGFHISGPNTGLAGYRIEAIEGEGYIDHIIPSLPLLEGTYLFSASLYDKAGQHPYDYHHMAYTFRVAPSEEIKERFGALYIPARWNLERSRVSPPGHPGHTDVS